MVLLVLDMEKSQLPVLDDLMFSIRNFIIDMAKAVTLKNNNNEEVYPVTDLSLVNGNIPTGRIADSAITTPKIANKAITSDKIDWTKLQKHYKACSQVNPFNIPTAWKQVTPSGWTLTFPTNSGEIYRVEIVTGYLCWNGGGLTELDMHLVYSGATGIATPASTMTGTYGGGVSIGRRVSGILKATGNSMTIKAGVASGSTGNYARIDGGYILAERIA